MRLKLSVGVLFVALALVGGNAFAQNYGMAGCGLGALAFGDSPNWMAQTAAATTNGTFATQGFGITSGTSECIEDGKVAMKQAQERFVKTNLRDLSKEMARGEGATLKAFSHTFNCQESAYPRFSRHMKDSYRRIFASPMADGVLSAVRQEIASDDVLSQACSV